MNTAPDPIAYPHGITAFDSGYGRPRMDAIHLVADSGRAAFIDTGTTHSVPRCLATLEALSIAPEDVDYVIVTHVHLDHAGGAGALLARLPRARLVVHPRGARHMIDPSKLVAGSIAVYGEERVRRDYGELVPVPAVRIIEAPDGFELTLGSRRLHFIDTPGHARHHFCILDTDHGNLFSGDTLGVSYREFDTARGPFVYPSTVPSQFDPEALHATLDRIEALEPRALYLTHYARVDATPAVFDDLRRRLDAIVTLVSEHADQPAEQIGNHLEHYLVNELSSHGVELDRDTCAYLLGNDIPLNVAGALQWHARMRNTEGGQ